MTRAAVQDVGATWEKRSEDNYGPPDFWLNNVRVEDKVSRKHHVSGLVFKMRHAGGLPYSPNAFDILQLTCVDEGVVYADDAVRRHSRLYPYHEAAW